MDHYFIKEGGTYHTYNVNLFSDFFFPVNLLSFDSMLFSLNADVDYLVDMCKQIGC